MTPQTVGAVLHAAAQDHPARPALQWFAGGELTSLTWRDMVTLAEAGAAALRTAPHSDAPVALWGPNSPAWVVLFYAAALSGRPLVPINPNLTDAEVAVLLADSRASTVLAAGELVGRGERLGHGAAGDIEVLDLQDWYGRLAVADSVSVDNSGSAHVRPTDPFLIQYTSGTTGTPKGAVLTHAACLEAAHSMALHLRLNDHEIWCSPVPLHHVGGSIAMALAPATMAGTYVMVADFAAGSFVSAAHESRATLLGGVPTLFLRILDDPELSRVQLPALSAVIVGGASIAPDLVQRLELHFGVPAAVFYGQSEGPVLTATDLHDPPSIKADTVGRPLPNRQVRIVDPVSGDPLAVGETGEIVVRTPTAMCEYLNRPDQTAQTIDADGWLHTGDLGCLDATGLLRFRGRLKEMIVRGGENVYAVEVENAIASHPDVDLVAVVGLPDERFGEIVAAAVIPVPGSSLSAEQLTRHVEGTLAPFKRPVRWHITDQLPMTASGKVQKFRIVEAMADEDVL
ncbi:acyl--CoA ligase [Mycobacterium sp. NBC_00419]|uniref:class I adenylate-forming enzyme family protein n=1 Tax=Mycobacterium sp. NBC_00419 TaxID=2975989 RepID=UPI002E1D50AF